jgi:hypothetical protein
MKGFPHRCSIVASLLVMMFFLASCAKEEPVAPASFSAQGTAKCMTPSTDDGSTMTMAGNGGDGGATGDGVGISDDGDDISGTERKRRPGS